MNHAVFSLVFSGRIALHLYSCEVQTIQDLLLMSLFISCQPNLLAFIKQIAKATASKMVYVKINLFQVNVTLLRFILSLF